MGESSRVSLVSDIVFGYSAIFDDVKSDGRIVQICNTIQKERTLPSGRAISQTFFGPQLRQGANISKKKLGGRNRGDAL